jgi:hypothetical protein
MMARSVRRNGTALSRRWKLGGEDNQGKEKKGSGEKWREVEIVKMFLEL